MYENLDDFGSILVADGKAIQNFATKTSKKDSGNRGKRDATYELPVDFEFEKHTIRGLKKIRMFLTVTFIIQLAQAKSKIEAGITIGLAKCYS